METHLSTLAATLQSIAFLQRPILQNPRPQPFTTAVLAPRDPNPDVKPPKDFIRESDSLERRFFHFPPIGGMLDEESASALQQQLQQGREFEDEGEGSSELIPRKPEIRNVAVPSPLRPSNANGVGSLQGQGGPSGSKEYDARALLIAAQRLNDNYSRAPRARKHIRTLIKKNQELINQTSTNNRQAVKLESVLERLAGGEDPDGIEELSALLGTPDPLGRGAAAEEEKRKQRRLRELKEKAQRVRDELNREEMEVLALEEMREEMLQQKRDLQRKITAASRSNASAARGAPRVAPTSSARGPRRSTEADKTASPATAKPTAAVSSAVQSRFTSGLKTGGATGRSRPSLAARVAGAAPSRRPPVPTTASPRADRSLRESTGPSNSSTSAGAADSDDDVTVRLKPDEIAAASAVAGADKGTPSGTPSRTAGGTGSAKPSPLRTATKPSSSAVSRSTSSRGDPEPTDELERLTEKIWDHFGDHLRFFHHSSSSSSQAQGDADFKTTLQLLRRHLSASDDEVARITTDLGGALGPTAGAAGGAGGGNAGDASSITSSNAQNGPLSSNAISSPTLQSRISSLVLLSLLLATPPEHAVDFAILKRQGKEWYKDHWLTRPNATTAKEDGETTAPGGEAEEDGGQLTTKAVYAMVAKRLLKVKRTGGPPKVAFH